MDKPGFDILKLSDKPVVVLAPTGMPTENLWWDMLNRIAIDLENMEDDMSKKHHQFYKEVEEALIILAKIVN